MTIWPSQLYAGYGGPRGVRRLWAPGGDKKKGSVADRESSIASCHEVALKKKKGKKKKIGRGPRERCLSFSRFGINNAWQGRKECNSKGIWERASLEVFAVSNNKTRTVLGTDAHSSVLHTIGQRKVVIELGFKAGHVWHTCPEERAEEAWLPWFPYIPDRFVGFIFKIRHIDTIFTFSSGVSVVSRLEKWPHKRFAYRHALEHDYWGSELGFAVNLVPRAFPLKNRWGATPIFQGKSPGDEVGLLSLYGLSSFDRFVLGDSRRRKPIFVPLTLRRGVNRYRQD